MKTVTKGKGITKPVATVKPKLKPVVGTKATDLTKKPSVSTSGIGKSMPVFKARPTPPPSRPPVAPKMKPFEKMSDKKDFRPSVNTVAAEEPHKTRYSDKELEEFDQLIDQKLIIAREQLEFYLKQLEDMAENPDNKIKSLDDGLSTLESERVSSLASRQQKLIQHLENAKIRIKNKVYGICRETGKLISKERLRAVPHATLSIEAKQAQY
ncbi:MAG TPA: TraR/DksA C4-type zinc finger protein [Saprospiraceae bacterium]|nr:TraR/DksA C4-type zinc finger protein [Saprospiraceae bacterium]